LYYTNSQLVNIKFYELQKFLTHIHKVTEARVLKIRTYKTVSSLVLCGCEPWAVGPIVRKERKLTVSENPGTYLELRRMK